MKNDYSDEVFHAFHPSNPDHTLLPFHIYMLIHNHIPLHSHQHVHNRPFAFSSLRIPFHLHNCPFAFSSLHLPFHLTNRPPPPTPPVRCGVLRVCCCGVRCGRGHEARPQHTLARREAVGDRTHLEQVLGGDAALFVWLFSYTRFTLIGAHIHIFHFPFLSFFFVIYFLICMINLNFIKIYHALDHLLFHIF